MTDAEKIEWFDEQIALVDRNFDSSQEARDNVEDCSDAPYDLWFDFIDAYAKHTGK